MSIKWIDLVQSQIDESSAFTLALVQEDNEVYASVMDFITEHANEEVPEEVLNALRSIE